MLLSFRRYSPLVLGCSVTLGSLAAGCGGGDDVTPGTGATAASSTNATGVGGGGATTTTGAGGAGGAGGDGAGGEGGRTPAPTVDCSPPVGDFPSVQYTSIASGLSNPVLVKAAPGDSTRLYVIEQPGRIRIIKDGALLDDPFLDIVSMVTNSGVIGDERGMLGLAFHPDYQANGRFFVHYSNKSSGGDTMIAEFARTADPDLADPTPTTVLTQDQPQSNHNGGSIEFSPTDGMLYIGLGDGGGADDQHGTIGNGQDLGTQLGKILRIDVTAVPYSIPPGNMTGAGVLPEIWDYGMRNPWRFSFDACTSDLYIGDVGQNKWEEIDVEPAGQGGKNYGWRLMEGEHCFNPGSNCDPTGMVVPPVAEYQHNQGCSVSGGYVYRGSAIPGLRGYYLYGDYCSGKVWALSWANGVATAPVSLPSTSASITSFGQDNEGEMYLVGQSGTIYRVDPG